MTAAFSPINNAVEFVLFPTFVGQMDKSATLRAVTPYMLSLASTTPPSSLGFIAQVPSECQVVDAVSRWYLEIASLSPSEYTMSGALVETGVSLFFDGRRTASGKLWMICSHLSPIRRQAPAEFTGLLIQPVEQRKIAGFG